jgi:hypothetical protein
MKKHKTAMTRTEQFSLDDDISTGVLEGSFPLCSVHIGCITSATYGRHEHTQRIGSCSKSNDPRISPASPPPLSHILGSFPSSFLVYLPPPQTRTNKTGKAKAKGRQAQGRKPVHYASFPLPSYISSTQDNERQGAAQTVASYIHIFTFHFPGSSFWCGRVGGPKHRASSEGNKRRRFLLLLLSSSFSM